MKDNSQLHDKRKGVIELDAIEPDVAPPKKAVKIDENSMGSLQKKTKELADVNERTEQEPYKLPLNISVVPTKRWRCR